VFYAEAHSLNVLVIMGGNDEDDMMRIEAIRNVTCSGETSFETRLVSTMHEIASLPKGVCCPHKVVHNMGKLLKDLPNQLMASATLLATTLIHKISPLQPNFGKSNTMFNLYRPIMTNPKYLRGTLHSVFDLPPD
jgi:hypothetical protein